MKRTFFTRCCAIVLAAGLAACSGGGSHSALPVAPGAGPDSGAGSLQITVPFAAGSSAGSKSPQYVSSGTQSAQVVAAPGSACTTCTAGGQTVNANLNASSPNCASGANGLTCTLAFKLAPGDYTLGIATYAGPLSGGSPSGALLSEKQMVPLTIVAGANSVATAVLDGVPASFDLVATQGALVKPASEWRATGWNSPMTISIITRDAAGAAIVGPGAPTYAATFQNPGNNWQNVAINGGTITATTATLAHPASLTIDVTATSPECSQPGAVCSATLQIGMDQYMAVVSRPTNTIVVYQIGLPAAPVATITQGLNGPNAVAFDLSGDLFVSNSGNNTVTEYAPPFTNGPAATMSTGISTPQALAVDRFTSDVAVSNAGNNTVAIFSPPYTGAPGVVSDAMHGPGAMAFDPISDDLYVAQSSNNTVTGYPAPYSGKTATSTISQGLNGPNALLFVGSGPLFVASNGSITRYDRPFSGSAPTATLASTAAAPVSKPYSLAFSGSVAPGLIIEADPFAQRVNLYPYGSATATASLQISPNPQCGILDADGILYVCNYAFTEMQAYPYPYTGSSVATYYQGLAGTDAVAMFP